MSWNPFAKVEDYPSMLTKIGWFTFFVSVVLVSLLRSQFDGFDKLLGALNIPVDVFHGVKMPLGTLLLAGAAGVVSHVSKFHNVLSNLFGIRKRFDIASILLPLASASGGVQSVDAVRRLSAERDRLMRETFYKYASSTKGKEVIDRHDILMAINMWTWYWILLEAGALIALVGLLFLIAGRGGIAAGLFFIFLAFQLFMTLTYRKCESYALTEATHILADPARRVAVHEVFGAL